MRIILLQSYSNNATPLFGVHCISTDCSNGNSISSVRLFPFLFCLKVSSSFNRNLISSTLSSYFLLDRNIYFPTTTTTATTATTTTAAVTTTAGIRIKTLLCKRVDYKFSFLSLF